MIGIIVMPMPRPWTNSAQHRNQYEVSVPSMMNAATPIAMRIRPPRTNLPGPILSVILPAIGMVSMAPMPCGASNRPAMRVDSPRTPMKYCGYSSEAPKKAIAKSDIVITATRSVGLRNSRRSMSGLLFRSACATKPMTSSAPMIMGM